MSRSEEPARRRVQGLTLAPPRTPIRTERSGDSSTCPPIGGLRAGIWSLEQDNWLWQAFFTLLSLGSSNPFPARTSQLTPAWARSTGHTEHRLLAGPFDWRIAQWSDADAPGRSAFDSGLYKGRCKKSERFGHVDLEHAAPLSLGDAFDVRVCILHKLVEPRRPRAIDATKVADRTPYPVRCFVLLCCLSATAWPLIAIRV